MSDHEHTLRFFGEELDNLKLDIQRLGAEALARVGHAVDALRGDCQPDAGPDAASDQAQAIEREAIRIISLRQPQAQDLRRVVAALKLTFVLERIAVLAHGAARRCLSSTPELSRAGLDEDIQRVGALACTQLKNALTAYANGETGFAQSVSTNDVEVDRAYRLAVRSLLGLMAADPASAERCADIMLALKAFERIADYAAVIADISHYEVVGRTITEAAAEALDTQGV